MCELNLTVVLASAMNKAGDEKKITIRQLIQYNKELLEKLPDYYQTFDLNDLCFEVNRIASEFEMITDVNNDCIIKLSSKSTFNYSSYIREIPKEIANSLENITLPA